MERYNKFDEEEKNAITIIDYVLQKKGEIINDVNPYNETYLVIACKKEYENIIKFLNDYGANVNIISNNNFVSEKIYENVAIILTVYGNGQIDKNIFRDALEIACKNIYDDILEYLTIN
ncbi:hypothetical protein H8356DRAFT_1344991 [Neocallimastix lanati (nom. inval.)]|nr:hypothetical protein H8356DRAFT_1344991 [Neocallimastix sp. JGI-2020a]